MSDRFSLVRWRHANADPPKWETLYVTDRGVLMYDAEADAWKDDDGRRWPVSVWCDPSPPGDDALMLADLQRLRVLASREALYAHVNAPNHPSTTEAERLAARLRRAIEEAER